MRHYITIVGLFFILNPSFSQSKWILVAETNISGSVSGTIQQGFIFKTFGAGFYIVNDYSIHIVVTVSPTVKIFNKGSDYKLVIEGFDEPVICKRINNVIETQIDGEFEGWEGETIFKLMNGQFWKQSSYEYMYHYSYNPEVLIYEFNDSWHLKVEDVNEIIRVEIVD